MLLVVLLHLSLAEELEDLTRNYCNIYSCKPPGVILSNTTCIYPSLLYSSYYLSPCPSSLPYCNPDLTSTKNTTCQLAPPPVVYSSYPGEPCNTTTDCLSGTCTSGVCFGSNVGQVCKSHLNCNPGLRCSNNICSSLLNIGASGCSSDYDCVPKAGCNKNSTTGVCIAYFTIASMKQLFDDPKPAQTQPSTSPALFNTAQSAPHMPTVGPQSVPQAK